MNLRTPGVVYHPYKIVANPQYPPQLYRYPRDGYTNEPEHAQHRNESGEQWNETNTDGALAQPPMVWEPVAPMEAVPSLEGYPEVYPYYVAPQLRRMGNPSNPQGSWNGAGLYARLPARAPHPQSQTAPKPVAPSTNNDLVSDLMVPSPRSLRSPQGTREQTLPTPRRVSPRFDNRRNDPSRKLEPAPVSVLTPGSGGANQQLPDSPLLDSSPSPPEHGAPDSPEFLSESEMKVSDDPDWLLEELAATGGVPRSKVRKIRKDHLASRTLPLPTPRFASAQKKAGSFFLLNLRKPNAWTRQSFKKK